MLGQHGMLLLRLRLRLLHFHQLWWYLPLSPLKSLSASPLWSKAWHPWHVSFKGVWTP